MNHEWLIKPAGGANRGQASDPADLEDAERAGHGRGVGEGE